MKLLYDRSDRPHVAKLRDNRFAWLKELGASELAQTPLEDEGVLVG